MGRPWRWRFGVSWREGSGTTKEGGMWDHRGGRDLRLSNSGSISVPQFPQGELYMGRLRGEVASTWAFHPPLSTIVLHKYFL